MSGKQVEQHQPADGPATGEWQIAELPHGGCHPLTTLAKHRRREQVLHINLCDIAAEVIVHHLPDIAACLSQTADEDDDHRQQKQNAGQFQ